MSVPHDDIEFVGLLVNLEDDSTVDLASFDDGVLVFTVW